MSKHDRTKFQHVTKENWFIIADLVDKLQEELTPANRVVNWFWEPTGATGKSWLARHLALHHNAVHVQMMKRDDMLHVLANRIKTTSKIIVFDITRTTVVDNPLMIYEILEMIKVNIFSVLVFISNRILFPYGQLY